MKNIKYYFLISLLVLMHVGCEDDTLSLQLQENPNELTPSSVNPDLLLNSVVFSTATAAGTYGGFTSGFVRHTHQFGSYTGAFSNGLADVQTLPWTVAYSAIANANVLIQVAEDRGLPHHLGVAQICKAWAGVTLADFVGDAPFSEAGNEEFGLPSPDNDEDIYQACEDLLNQGIANLGMETSVSINNDPLGGSIDAWTRAANSLKIFMFVGTRLVSDRSSEINDIVASGNYISTVEEDFEFEYSSVSTPTDSRSGLFQNSYINGGSFYINNYFIDKLKNRFSEPDPRINYYLYRQTLEDPTGENDVCSGSDIHDICYIGDGYWGRDHGDDEGVPPDNLLRTIPGIYPAGGAYDAGQGISGTQAQTLSGAGIEPFIMSSFVDFILAEAALTMNVNGDPRSLLESGIRKSFEKVFSFAPGNHTQTDIDNYVRNVLAVYDQAMDDEERLNVIVTELYLASFGSSGIMYNAYRRTGLPSDMQSPIISIGQFPRSMFISPIEVNANINVNQKSVTDQVFWDNNPADFVE